MAMNFSMRAGPKGAAPPLTVSTEESIDAFTIGFVDRKLQSKFKVILLMS